MNGTSSQGDSRMWEVLCHLSALLMFLGVPFGNILGPLIVWLLKRSDSSSIDEHGKESLNFQLSLTLYLIALTVVTISLLFVLIGFVLLPVLIAAVVIGPLVDVIFIIIAAIKASSGEFYRYPFTIRFVT